LSLSRLEYNAGTLRLLGGFCAHDHLSQRIFEANLIAPQARVK